MTECADFVTKVNYMDVDYKLIQLPNKILLNYTFEYCSSYDNLPPFVSVILKIFSTFSPGFIHPCPYLPMKKVGVENLPVEMIDGILMFVNFKRGSYVSSFDIRDKNGEFITYSHNYFTVSQKRPQKGG